MINLQQKCECFKAYDIRGKLGSEINENISYRIGYAVTKYFSASNIVIGFDARETSPMLSQAVAKGARDAGADIIDIGLSGTEEMYSAVTQFSADLGIEITASHNPIEYNGMKIVKSEAQPLTNDEFTELKFLAERVDLLVAKKSGKVYDRRKVARLSYIDRISRFINPKTLKPLKIVINSGNGAAGSVIDSVELFLKRNGVKTNFIKIFHDPDPTFPNGIPNPLLPENRALTGNYVIEQKADFGIAFDGDFDRCFFFDNFGSFISGEYIIGLLAEIFLCKEIGATIIHDPRVIWNTLNVVKKFNGIALASKTGHVYFKQIMRKADAVYGGEISAHHYFRDFAYCDSGMIPWLLVWEFLSQKNMSLSSLVSEQKKTYISSGEINFTVSNVSSCLAQIKQLFYSSAKQIDDLDGLSMVFDGWRFNLRLSNTEPLLRLNVEAKGDEELLNAKVRDISQILKKI